MFGGQLKRGAGVGLGFGQRAASQRNHSPPAGGRQEANHRSARLGVGQYRLGQRMSTVQLIGVDEGPTGQYGGQRLGGLFSEKAAVVPPALHQPGHLMTTLAANSQKSSQHQLRGTAGRSAQCGQVTQPLKGGLRHFGRADAEKLHGHLVGVQTYRQVRVPVTEVGQPGLQHSRAARQIGGVEQHVG